jgi:hypothetical protein
MKCHTQFRMALTVCTLGTAAVPFPFQVTLERCSKDELKATVCAASLVPLDDNGDDSVVVYDAVVHPQLPTRFAQVCTGVQGILKQCARAAENNAVDALLLRATAPCAADATRYILVSDILVAFDVPSADVLDVFLTSLDNDDNVQALMVTSAHLYFLFPDHRGIQRVPRTAFPPDTPFGHAMDCRCAHACFPAMCASVGEPVAVAWAWDPEQEEATA